MPSFEQASVVGLLLPPNREWKKDQEVLVASELKSQKIF